ncbi:androgen-dependent TFPI-regulating protein [Amyelois transitella]|uniref:androgen-dependent TFPI-regulating protein n=1 Tax=Amyelois transitella TaxID=680683 RepID=UPI00067C39E0|nr:androgen-dependent TFPI-regulating protein [Amyelois transitella]
MKNYIHHRVFAYIATILVHVGNLAYLDGSLRRKMLLYPDLKIYTHFQPRYLTIWNVLFQLLNAGIGLYIDLKTLQGKGETIPKRLVKFKNTFFNSIVFPYTVLVVSLFWPIFAYDRNLVFPTRADLFVPKICNHVLHSFVLPVVLWDLAFQPGNVASCHKKNCIYIFVMYCLYNCVLFYTNYGDIGLWPYQILTVLEGTIFFPLFFLHIFVTLYVSYFLQWRIRTSLCALTEKISLKSE